MNKALSFGLIALLGVSLHSCAPREHKQPDLPKRPDRWVNAVTLDPDSKVTYIGTTKHYLITDVSSVKDVNGLQVVRVGDVVDGLRIGAIRCSFYWIDASYGGEQYMWRGRWGCQAGRRQEEVEKAVAEDSDKRFDYLHVSPVEETGLAPAA